MARPMRQGQKVRENMQEILTLDEAARLLRIHTMTAYSLIQKGKMPGRKVGGQWRFLRAELLAWMSKDKEVSQR